MQRNDLIAAALLLAFGTHVAAHESGAAATSDTIFANGFENPTLTIDNYLAWCEVSVDGAPLSINPPPTQFTQGTVVPLSAEPASSAFIWGYWRFTDVSGHDTSPNTTVTMTSDRTVFVCCPFTDGTGCPAD